MGVISQMAGTRLRIFGSRQKHPGNAAVRRVLIVSHEATRTGAPKIILNLLKRFSDLCDVQFETVLHSGGHLATEFAIFNR